MNNYKERLIFARYRKHLYFDKAIKNGHSGRGQPSTIDAV